MYSTQSHLLKKGKATMAFMKTRKRAAPAGEKDGEYISWPRQHLPWIPVASAHLALCTEKEKKCNLCFYIPVEDFVFTLCVGGR